LSFTQQSRSGNFVSGSAFVVWWGREFIASGGEKGLDKRELRSLAEGPPQNRELEARAVTAEQRRKRKEDGPFTGARWVFNSGTEARKKLLTRFGSALQDNERQRRRGGDA